MNLTAIGPYEIERRLAAGGMAEVFVAHRRGPHGFRKRVALKRILPQYARDPDFVSMFIDEAKVAARLDHPNVVQVFDFGEHGKDLFLAMELVEGSTVNRILRAATRASQRVPIDVAIHIAAETARALAYAHRLRDLDGEPMNFVHRDVSPANVLLTSSGHVKLTDFGIAKVVQQSRRTEDGHVRGKLGYMSPEQVLGKEVDGRSDVFTLSTLFAELLIGEPLFGRGSELDVLIRIRDVDLSVLYASERKLPDDIRRLLDAALSRNPEERPSADAFADICDELRRRRKMARGPQRLARVLQQLSLVEAPCDETDSTGRLTAMIDTSSLSVETDMEGVAARVGATTPEIYRVQTASGEVGPMSFPALVQLITSGAVRGETLISKEEGGFAPANDLEELSRFVTSPALSWRPEDLVGIRRRGEIEAGSMLGRIHDLMRARETGVLHLFTRERRKKIYLVEGRPEFVASTVRSELLGEFLVTQGICLRMEVEMALALMPRYGGRLGDALVGLGALRPVQLFRAISGQVRARLLEAFTWREGEWAFVEDARSHEEAFPIEDVGQVLLRDAAMHAAMGEIEAHLAPRWEHVLSTVPDAGERLWSFRVPKEWAKVILACSQTTVGAVLARVASQSTEALDATYRALHLGISCGIIRARSASAPPE